MEEQFKHGQIDGLKEYLRVYLGQHPLAWTTLVGWAVGRALNLSVPTVLVAEIIDNMASGKTGLDGNLRYLLLATASVIVGETIIRFSFWFLNHLQVRAADKLLVQSYSTLLHKSQAFHASNFAGSITTKVNRFVRNSISFGDLLHFNVMDFIGFLAFTAWFVGRENWPALLVSVGCMTLYAIVALPFIKTRSKMVRERSIMESARTGSLVDGITNVMAVKSFAREEQEVGRFRKEVNQTGDFVIKTWNYNLWRLDPITVSFYILVVFGPLFIVLSLGSFQTEDASNFFVVYSLFAAIGIKIWEFSRTWRNVEQYLSEAAEALDLLRSPGDIEDTPKALPLKISRGAIEIESMVFNYENLPLFKGLQLSIQPNEKIGLVGPSGGGKSTLMKLLLRFMDIESGSIKIDDQDISDVSQKSLRKKMSYIPQEPVLFHRTILENIRFSKPSATKAAVIAAAKKAYAHEFIEKLPEGYDTIVGERGVKLSGGQRQRVAIARAFLKEAPILLLDEATSALDSESEELIQRSLKKLMKQKTVISIAHRLSTLQQMDRIIVIKDGAIHQEGTHSQLSKKKGLYKRLWDHQSGGYIE